MTEPSSDLQPTPHPRWWHSRWLQAGVSVAVVVLIFGFLFPKLADYGEVWQTIVDMTPIELLSLGGVAIWNLVSYWPVLTAVLPGMRTREAAVSNLASTAVANTLPGGGALGIGVTVKMQNSWGIPVADVALAGVVSGIWNNFVKLGLPVIALGLLAVTGEAGIGLATAAIVGLAVLVGAIVGFALVLRSQPLAWRVGERAGKVVTAVARPLRRGPVIGWGDGAVRFRASTIGLLSGRAVRITLATIASHLSLFLVLLVALRHVGVSNDEVSWVKVLSAFAFVRLLSAVPVTPGGLGVVELGLTAAMGSGLPDATKNQIAAAVLLYRALTWFAPIPLGMICWVFWRSNTSWRHTVDERALARPVPLGSGAE
ncbi:MAG: flippase-like domain-containing protein [Actinomycetota bacterium]|nr:flippase-like domain-containing protein [Actinomycetota bacterium]